MARFICIFQLSNGTLMFMIMLVCVKNSVSMFHDFIQKQARPRNLLILFLLMIVVNLILFPLLLPHKDDRMPLDLMFAYTPCEAYSLIETYGEIGRQSYIRGLLLIDFIYPVIYTLFIAFSIFMIYRKTLPSFSPLLILVSDYIENAGIIIMLASYPTELITVAWITSFFTSVKWILVGLTILAIIFGLLRRIKQKD